MVVMMPNLNNRNVIELCVSSLNMISVDIVSIEEVLKSVNSYVCESYSMERLRASLSSLSERLSTLYYFVCDNWDDIEKNPILSCEVLSFVNSFRVFENTLRSLGQYMDRNTGCLESEFSDSFIVYEYFSLLNESKRRFAEVLMRIPQICEMNSVRRSKFRGIAKDLKQYVRGANDEFFDRLIYDHVILGGKVEWIGPKNEATLFAQKYMLSQKIMNDAFIFHSKNGSCSIVQFSKDKCCNEKESYRIWPILSKYAI